jgi:hypothetical protein
MGAAWAVPPGVRESGDKGQPFVAQAWLSALRKWTECKELLQIHLIRQGLSPPGLQGKGGLPAPLHLARGPACHLGLPGGDPFLGLGVPCLAGFHKELSNAPQDVPSPCQLEHISWSPWADREAWGGLPDKPDW